MTSRKLNETDAVRTATAPGVVRELTTELLQQIRREEDEISTRVARDIDVLRRRNPQNKLARWQ